MDAVMCASSQIRGRWGPLQMHPLAPPPSPHPTYPGTTSPSPGHHASPSRWMEVSRYQFCHHAGVAPNPPASCAFHNLKARLSYLMILYDFFFVCTLCGPGSSLPPVFQPGSAKSMAAELDKIRNGTNCAHSLYRISQRYQKNNAWKTHLRIY